MPAPRAVREAEERANALHAELYGNEQETGKGEHVEPAPHADEPGPGEQPEQIASPDPEPAPAPGGNEEEVDWKAEHERLNQAHKVLQGKYSAEVPRMAQQIRELKAALDKAKQQAEAAQQAEAKANAKLEEQLEGMRREFGDDFVGTMQSLVSETANQQIEKLKQETAEEREERFWRDLRRMVPDFDQVNVDPKFIQWLQSPNPHTGLPYQSELNEAGADRDAFAVAEIVREFKSAQQPKPKPQPQPTPPEQQLAPKPGQTRSRTPQEKPTYTADDFAELQRQIQRGMWRGRMEEARALEREIHAALTGQ